MCARESAGDSARSAQRASAVRVLGFNGVESYVRWNAVEQAPRADSTGATTTRRLRRVRNTAYSLGALRDYRSGVHPARLVSRQLRITSDDPVPGAWAAHRDPDHLLPPWPKYVQRSDSSSASTMVPVTGSDRTRSRHQRQLRRGALTLPPRPAADVDPAGSAPHPQWLLGGRQRVPLGAF